MILNVRMRVLKEKIRELVHLFAVQDAEKVIVKG